MKEEKGEIKINREIVAVIAGRATSEVKGVAGMSGGVVDGITKVLGKKNPEKGVKVEMEDEGIGIDLSIVVEYGVSIPDVCLEIQADVKKKVEEMTGKEVRAVNINVQGIHFPEFAEEEK